MRVRAAIVAMVLVGLLWPAGAAAGGGWDSMHFRRDHYLVGEVATATDLFYAGALKGSGPLDGRTYYAYLLPRSATQSGFGMVDPPTIPEGSIRLGALEIDPSVDPKHYAGPYARASLTFHVPDVPSGDYAIGFCDDPCVHGYVGWLAWGSIRIVHTEQEGALMAALDRQETEQWRIRTDLRRAERNVEELREALDDATHAGRSQARALMAEERRAAELQQALLALRDRPPAEGPEPATWPLVLAWSIAVAALGLALLTMTSGRRRRSKAFVVPDTVPDDLEVRERASEPVGS